MSERHGVGILSVYDAYLLYKNKERYYGDLLLIL